MGRTESPLPPDEPSGPAARSAVRRAVEAASRAEAQALLAHRRAMALSLRAAHAHEQAAWVAGRLGMDIQASLHTDLADRARDAARSELGRDADRARSENGSSV